MPTDAGDGDATYRPLESALFGIPVYAADAATPEGAARALTATRMTAGALLVLRIPADRMQTVRVAERAGALLCDALVTLTRTVPAGGIAVTPVAGSERVRAASTADADTLAALGRRAFSRFSGHWHTDARVPSKLADELYARWIHDLARDMVPRTRVWVAENPQGATAGFLALRNVATAHWDVPLTAVDPDARGRGLLRTMLAAATADVCRNSPARLDYETQLANTAAMASVGRIGFAPLAARLTYHWWCDDAITPG